MKLIPARELIDGAGRPLTEGEKVVLAALAQFPNGISRGQLQVLTGYKRSTRNEYLRRLRHRELIEQTPSGARASEHLFS